jgi:hypothetical protein
VNPLILGVPIDDALNASLVVHVGDLLLGYGGCHHGAVSPVALVWLKVFLQKHSYKVKKEQSYFLQLGSAPELLNDEKS